MARRRKAPGRDEWQTTIRGCLRAAAKLLESRSQDATIGWSPSPLASDVDGDPVEPSDPYAVHWSISGAVQAVALTELTAVSTMETIQIALAEGETAWTFSLIRWEAEASPSDVIDLMRRAEEFVRRAKHPRPPKDIAK